MPPDKRQSHVGGYVKSDGTRVRSHTRSAQWARAKSIWIGAGFSTLGAAGILWELGVTIISVGSLALIAVLGTVAVIVGRHVEKNRKTMARQHRTRRPTRTTSSRARTSSSRTGSRSRTTNYRKRW